MKHYSMRDFPAATITAAPEAPVERHAPRAFDLHPALLVATIGSYFAFLAIMGAAFMNAELVIPFAIFVTYIAMAFGVPGLWARIAPQAAGRHQSWGEFLRQGVETATGRLSGRAAIAQVLVLPALLLFWASAILVIRLSV